MPTFDAFAERLTHEQDKLIQMGSLSSIDAESHALVAQLQIQECHIKSHLNGNKHAVQNQGTLHIPLLNLILKGRKFLLNVPLVERMVIQKLIVLRN